MEGVFFWSGALWLSCLFLREAHRSQLFIRKKQLICLLLPIPFYFWGDTSWMGGIVTMAHRFDNVSFVQICRLLIWCCFCPSKKISWKGGVLSVAQSLHMYGLLRIHYDFTCSLYFFLEDHRSSILPFMYLGHCTGAIDGRVDYTKDAFEETVSDQ